MARKTIYAVYRGDEFIDVGTAKELSERLGYSEKTFSRKAWKTKNGCSRSVSVYIVGVEKQDILYGDWILANTGGGAESRVIHYLAKRASGEFSTLCKQVPTSFIHIDNFDLKKPDVEEAYHAITCKRCAERYRQYQFEKEDDNYI